jgi:hypothetical protein
VGGSDDAVRILRQVVLPLALSYLWFAWMILSWIRGRAGSGRPPRPLVVRVPTWRRFAAGLLRTAALGYAVFILSVGAHCIGFAGGEGCVRTALGGGAFLAFVVGLPGFLVGGWLEGPGGELLRRLLRRAAKPWARSAGPPPPGPTSLRGSSRAAVGNAGRAPRSPRPAPPRPP